MKYSEQLLGISNAIVDILVHVDKKFLDDVGAPPGSMTLIDEKQAEKLYSLMDSPEKISGGSVANTIAGFANLGGDSAYIGKVHNDVFGNIFNNDMRALGIDVRLKPTKSGSSTARSHILISEDGQRTMQTYLGACLELCLSDISPSVIKKPKVILLEGYVWDIENGPLVAKKVAEIGKKNNATIAMSLSDSFCVDRHRNQFEMFVKNETNIVFADEDEINALLGTQSIEEIIKELSKLNTLFVITRAEKGSIIIQNELVIAQDAMEVKEIIDTTGAGDAYAAGFLFGWVKNFDLSECAKYGTYCATKIIQQIGARIDKDLLNTLI